MLISSLRGLMSAEHGKPPLFPLWHSNLETRVDPEKTPKLSTRNKRQITLKRFPIRFPKFP